MLVLELLNNFNFNRLIKIVFEAKLVVHLNLTAFWIKSELVPSSKCSDQSNALVVSILIELCIHFEAATSKLDRGSS
jgi:hypothetical protein